MTRGTELDPDIATAGGQRVQAAGSAAQGAIAGALGRIRALNTSATWGADEAGEAFAHAYNEITELPGATYVDGEAAGAYRYDGDRWATFDNPETIAAKTGYVRESSLGRVALANLDSDTSGDLVTAIADGLNG